MKKSTLAHMHAQGRGRASEPTKATLVPAAAKKPWVEPSFRRYEALVACRETGQIDDAQWARLMEDDDFAAWYLVEALHR